MSHRPPQYCRYRGSYARTKVNGKWVHLGPYDAPESKAKYKRLVAQWGAGLPPDSDDDDGVTVVEILAEYLEHAQRYYGDHPKSRYHHMRRVVKTVRELYADLPAIAFTPKKLKTVRQVFVDRGNCRRQVNDDTRDVLGIFAWAVEQELIPGSVVHGLREVKSLRRGRTDAPEGKTVTSVPQAIVDATMPELTPVLQDMVMLQLVSGARPGEICAITPKQIDRTGDVWLYAPDQHKTAHHGKTRVIAFGPKAQAILQRYLLRPDDTPCFSPREALKQHLEQREAERTTPLNHGNKPKPKRRARTIERVSDRYDVPEYRRAITRACKRAGVEHWSPNRLRHAAATQVRERYGLDGCQSLLGHSHARVSEVYAELSTAKAVEIARQLG